MGGHGELTRGEEPVGAFLRRIPEWSEAVPQIGAGVGGPQRAGIEVGNRRHAQLAEDPLP
jgi:hypothetical protein